jgi:ABC-2 type transporter
VVSVRELPSVRLWLAEVQLTVGIAQQEVWMQVRLFVSLFPCIKLTISSLASALDYAKSLKVITRSLHKTTIATFYQASEAIFQQFDRVLLLDKGHCIYFGPTSEARNYFLNLGFYCEPRKSTPDFLTGITNPQERKIREGAVDVPLNSVDLERAYRSSPAYETAMADLKQYEEELKLNVCPPFLLSWFKF